MLQVINSLADLSCTQNIVSGLGQVINEKESQMIWGMFNWNRAIRGVSMLN